MFGTQRMRVSRAHVQCYQKVYLLVLGVFFCFRVHVHVFLLCVSRMPDPRIVG